MKQRKQGLYEYNEKQEIRKAVPELIRRASEPQKNGRYIILIDNPNFRTRPDLDTFVY
jgi:hypothetical protein